MNNDFKPSRETKVQFPIESNSNSEMILAVSFRNVDSKLFVPFKVYRIKLRPESVRVIDEQYEVAVYSNNFFLRLQFPAEAFPVLSSPYVQVS